MAIIVSPFGTPGGFVVTFRLERPRDDLARLRLEADRFERLSRTVCDEQVAMMLRETAANLAVRLGQLEARARWADFLAG